METGKIDRSSKKGPKISFMIHQLQIIKILGKNNKCGAKLENFWKLMISILGIIV